MKIPIRKLITHAHCADGLATAIIVREAHPDVPIVFAQYNTAEHEALAAEPGLVFCDMTPPRYRAREFVQAGAWVLDHHAHARDIVQTFGERGVYASEPGRSGAVLAAEYLGDGTAATATLAELAGVRDTWQRASPLWESATDLQAVLMHFPPAHWLDRRGAPLRAIALAESLGPMLVGERARKVREVVEHGALYLTAPDDRTWMVFPDREHLISDVAEAGRERGCPVAVAWFGVVDDGKPRTVFSMRSDGSLDVGALATLWGGGGHARAAGFSLSGWGSPFAIVRRLQRGETLLRSEVKA